MKSFYFIFISLLGFVSDLFAQNVSLKTERIVLITLDGLRWQEVFTGADSLLVDDSGWVKKSGSLLADYWDQDFSKRREKLMPFVWGTMAKEGQLYGNRKYGNKGSTSNSLWFSYPGYNELLSGYADDMRITSNDKVNNPNVTFLEYLQRNPLYEGQVKAVGGWDVFPYILHENR
ncbi:MAG: phosphoglyceromutase, partial [Cyclobacteriaceae bacterium]|nr:phosphoglyceromutase [Cyclobacteriaceae bacterium]